MKKFYFLLIALLCSATMAFAEEVALTLHVETPGTLSDLIFDAGYRPIEVHKLTLTGTLNNSDFTTMRETMTELIDVDLSGITNTEGVNFSKKTTLKNIILPSNLEIIDDGYYYDENGAFWGCESLTSIVIPNTVTKIGNSAFAGCNSLISCVLPASVEAIGEFAFSGCSSLSSINIPNGITAINEYTFSGCSSLSSIEIPNGVISIEENAFRYCYSLTSIEIPGRVNFIGEFAFGDCYDLRVVTLGSGLQEISYGAFVNTTIDTIICLGINPSSVDLYCWTGDRFSFFEDIDKNLCVLKVPTVAYNSYIRHAVWGQFVNIEQMNITYYNITAIANNSEMGEVIGGKYYLPNETVTLEATAYNGYRFVKWSDGVTENPRTFTATEDLILTANFAVRPYEVTLTCNEARGTVSGGGEYEPGSQVTITATAKEGYQFSYWRIYYNEWDYNTVYENPYTFEMGSQFYDIEAVFEKAKVLVDGLYYYLNDDNTASVTYPNGDEYSGDIVIPETIVVGGNTYTVTTIGSYAFYKSYITSVSIPATVTYIDEEGFYDCYQLRIVKFNSTTPPVFYDKDLFDYGYCGKRMNVPCGSISSYEEAFGTGDCWYFAEGEYALNVYTDYENCYVEIQDNIGCEDNQATIYAYSNSDYYSFKQWSDGNTDNPRTVIVTSDTTFVAEFIRSYLVEVYSSDESRGTVSEGGRYLEGDSAVIIATPAEGYVFDYWEVYYNWYSYEYEEDGSYGSSYTTQENPFEIESVYDRYKLIAHFRIARTLVDGIYYYLDKENYSAVVARSEDYTGDIVLPETVTHNRTIYDVTGIEQNAFAGTSITSLAVPNNIRNSVWLYECFDLKVLKAHADFISNIDGLYDTNIEELYYTGGYVEYVRRISSLKVIDLSVTENTELERSLFREDADGNYEGFYNLRKLVLPNGLIKIHDRQFESLWLLEEVVIPEGVTEIPDGAFYDCHALSKVTLSKNLTSIGNYAFYSCHALENIVIPEGVTEIGNAAFYGCTYLENIELPYTLEEVGNNAFALCSKIKSIKAKAYTPPTLWAKTFYEVDRNTPVYVAEVAYDDYVADQYWGEFFNIIATPEYNEDPTDVENTDETSVVIYTQGGMLYVEGVETDYNVFDASGRLIYTGRDTQLSLPRGVYMIHLAGETQKVVL